MKNQISTCASKACRLGDFICTKASSAPAAQAPALIAKAAPFPYNGSMLDADRFQRHGALSVSPDATHLMHADGHPFFYLADTAWNGALLSSQADWHLYLDDRASKGFTAIQMIAHAPWTAALADAQGRVSFTGDPAHPLNDEFFKQIEERIQAVNQKGMLAVMVLAWAANFGSSSRLNIGHTASAGELIPILRAMVERLSKHQVMLLLAGDGIYDSFFKSRKWLEVGRGVFEGGARPLVGLHPMGLSWPYRKFKHERWLDIYGYQSSHSTRPATLRWLQQGPPATQWQANPKPVINLEPVYEGIGQPPFDAAAVRNACYWSLLNAPTAGVAYGAHGVWSWQSQEDEPLNHAGLGVAKRWQDAMQFPGSHQMKHLASFFTAIDWWTLRPRPQLLKRQPSSKPADFVSSSCAKDGRLAVIYSPTAKPIELNQPLAGEVRWFNPRTGEYSAATPTHQTTFTPPHEGDWLLLARPSGD